MSTNTTLSSNSGIELKGGMYTLTTIQVLDDNIEYLSQQLEEKIKQAPNFFHYAPIILDVQRLQSHPVMLDFQALVRTLKSKKLIPVGVRGTNKALREAAIQAGLAVFPDEKNIAASTKRSNAGTKQELLKTDPTSQEPTTTMNGPTRVILQPVRSGQQVYAQGSDLIVLAAVSHGAEILADGHIHVYGNMRGRALAGVKGNKNAMIFCKSLEAELVSIAGQYRLCEDLKETCWKESVSIQLQDERLHIRIV